MYEVSFHLKSFAALNTVCDMTFLLPATRTSMYNL